MLTLWDAFTAFFSGYNKQDDLFLKRLITENIIAMTITMLSINIASVVDGIVIGRFLGPEAVSAFGLTKPVISYLFFGLAGILMTGFQTICARKMGEGERDEAAQLFTMAIVCCLLVAAAGMLVGLPTSGALAAFLGAEGSLQDLTGGYLFGWFIGLPAYMLQIILQPFVRMEGGTKRVTVAVVAMSVTDIAADLLCVLVFDGGMPGIALATSLSNYVCTAVLLSHFRGENRIFKLRFSGWSLKELFPALKQGLPSAVGRCSNMLKSFLLNHILLAIGGVISVSAFSVWNSLYSFTGALESGIASTVMLLVGIQYGEPDTTSLHKTIKLSRKYDVIGNGVIALFTIIGAPFISKLFFGEVSRDVVVCLRICALYMPVYSLCTLNQKYFQGISNLSLANITGILTELVLLIPVAGILGLLFGINGIWTGFPVTCVLVLLILRLVRHVKKKDELFLPDDYQSSVAAVGEYSVHGMEDVMGASAFVSDFCMEHNGDKRRSLFLALAVEEISRNTVEYGFHDGKRHQIDMLVIIYKNGDITLRMKDDCKIFDSEKYYIEHRDNDPALHIGIRMVFKMAKDGCYVPMLRRNSLIVKI